ncbi:MAG: hypothetical protein P1V36_12565 [Planctomycetota bacterium]|nr:hypothetical protein [Planctomycetota bacterium]
MSLKLFLSATALMAAGAALTVFALCIVSVGETSSAAAEAATAPKAGDRVAFEIAFKTHLDMDLPEQDAFIEREPGSGKLYRVTKGDHDMKAPLFRTAHPVKHDPFDPKAVGPYEKGEALGVTLGEWLRHRGTGVYTYEDGVGTLDLEFSGLVPGGVYTMWHAFMALPPTQPFSGALELPLGARDGSESVFVADAEGKAKFVHSFKPGLEMSDVWTTSMLAINYHSDGKTYGGLPGDFGLNAHIPLFVMLPKRAGLD